MGGRRLDVKALPTSSDSLAIERSVAPLAVPLSLRRWLRRHRLIVAAQSVVGVGLVLLALMSDVSDAARAVGVVLAIVVTALLVPARSPMPGSLAGR